MLVGRSTKAATKSKSTNKDGAAATLTPALQPHCNCVIADNHRATRKRGRSKEKAPEKGSGDDDGKEAASNESESAGGDHPKKAARTSTQRSKLKLAKPRQCVTALLLGATRKATKACAATECQVGGSTSHQCHKDGCDNSIHVVCYYNEVRKQFPTVQESQLDESVWCPQHVSDLPPTVED
jgi:hypothetical protein